MTKYFYEGVPLKKYCEKHGLSYHHIVNQYLKSDGKKSLDYIIKHYTDNLQTIKFYVTVDGKKMTLCKYCKINCLDYQLIKSRFARYPNLTLEEALNFKSKRSTRRVIYNNQEMSLFEACKIEGLDSCYVCKVCRDKNMTVQEAFERALNRKRKQWSDFEEWKKERIS